MNEEAKVSQCVYMRRFEYDSVREPMYGGFE